MPRLTTVAGRHAADLFRARNHEAALALQDAALHRLDVALRAFGLTTHPHFDRSLECDRSLWVNCRLDTARTDHERIYAILDEQGWKPDRSRLSRFRSHLDVARIRHQDSDATMVLIVKVPSGAVVPLEAA